MEEVTYYNKAEATKEKIPNVYQDFTYDDEVNGGVLNKFTEIKTQIGKIKGDINSLSSVYNSNLVRSYEKFSNFETTINSITTNMNNNVDGIENSIKNIITTAEQTVRSHMSTDSSFMSDLERINSLLGK